MNPLRPAELRILVVEDDAHLRTGTARLLEKAGYAVSSAADGGTALQAVADHRPHLLLLDRNLPDLDGLEVCRRLKRDRATADMLVIMLSASYAESDEQAEGLESGADGYITRPIANRELLARVEAYARIVGLNRSLRLQKEALAASAEAAARTTEASLNLMEDAVEAQRRLEAANQSLQREIAERTQAETELKRTNRALRVVSAGNDALLYATDESKLLQEICRIAVEEGGYAMAWVGLAEPDTERTVRPVAAAGDTQGYLAAAAISWADVERGRGPTGTAIRTQVPDVCQHLQSDPRMAPWHEAARRCGYVSSLALPLIDDDRAYGALTIYAAEPAAFIPTETKLLGDLGVDISFGLASLRMRRDRDRAEEALRASEERFRSAAANANDLVYEWDLHHKLEWFGDIDGMLGYEPDEFPRTLEAWLAALQAEDREKVKAAIAAHLEHQATYAIEYRMRRKDGTERWWSARGAAIGVQAGKPTRWIGTVTDITEQKSMEQKFLRAQRLESLGMLAAGISHDLNNVLAPIIFAAPMLREKLSTVRDLKILDTLERSAERGAGLVKQILGFVRTTSGEARLTQVKHLVRDIITVIEETFPKSIQFEHHVPPNLWPVLGNATQIHQVLLNLCVNARDAMPQGGTLRLIVANRQLEPAEAAAIPEGLPGAWISIEVSDTGTGITPEVLAQIWTPFFTTKGAEHGTGLGLTTVRSIVKNHRGFIELQTAPGQGTTFRIYLPATESTPARASGDAPAAIPRGQGQHVLVVDDDAAIRNIVTEVLETYGYRVSSCADGVEAISAVTNHPGEFALVVTDVDMPRLGGLALIQALQPMYPSLRILAMSGMAQSSTGPSDIPQIRNLAHEFLFKPFSGDDLLKAVHLLLCATAPD